MTNYRETPFRALLIAVILIIPVAVFAAGGRVEPVGPMNVGFSQVDWSPMVDRAAISLTVVAPDGQVIHKDFTDGKAPSFRIADIPGKGVPEGTYTYELRVTPKVSVEVRRALEAARETDDKAEMERLQRENHLGAEIVQSGAFSIHNGSFVGGNEIEPARQAARTPLSTTTNGKPPLQAAPEDQVIADDLIVQGSACVGLDCVNNESFGFDTIRLKENNTRIKFDDTSTAAGFPNNDWQLTANDSASGGANKFSIDDITGSKVPFTITAGAASNSIFVDSTGRVGFRTSTPVLDLHVNTSNTPALRLEQNSGGGFSAQTWDVAGNEANFFVRDVTSGSRLPFRIRPGAPTSSIDINASGNVGINTASPSKKLHVIDATSQVSFTQVQLEGATGGFGAGIEMGAPLTGGSYKAMAKITGDGDDTWTTTASTQDASIRFFTSLDGTLAERVRISAAGFLGIGVTPSNPIQHSSGALLTAGGVWTNASSRALKMNITALAANDAMNALKGLEPVEYVYKVDPKEHHVGFIAEDVPSIVATQDRKSLSPMDIVAVLTKVVQEQQKTIDELSARVKELEKKQ